MKRTVALLACMSAGVAVACERGDGADRSSDPVTMSLTADSIIEMRRDTLADGTETAECAITLRAAVEGPEGEHVVLRGGTIEFIWWSTGNPAIRHDFSQYRAAEFWTDSIIAAGSAQQSNRQSFTQNEPAQPVRGTARFRYGTSNAEEEQETTPLRFYCY
jgi:hypothetical protein